MKEKFRKDLRLPGYDYAQQGSYFVTVCTNFKQDLLIKKSNKRVVAGFHACQEPFYELTEIGGEVEKTLQYIHEHYDGVSVDKYCIMPNHVHILFSLQAPESETGRHGSLPLRDVVGRLKSYTTKQYRSIINQPKAILWQRNYYEHVIRNDEDYAEKWRYIDENPHRRRLLKHKIGS